MDDDRWLDGRLSGFCTVRLLVLRLACHRGELYMFVRCLALDGRAIMDGAVVALCRGSNMDEFMDGSQGWLHGWLRVVIIVSLC